MAVEWAPLLPLPFIGGLGVMLLGLTLLRFRAHAGGAVLRLIAGSAVLLFLLGPTRIEQNFESLPDQILLLLDDSGSMTLSNRAAVRDRAEERIRERLAASGYEVVTQRFGSPGASDLGEGLTEALGSVPRSQLSGVMILTDGRVTGTEAAAALDIPVPVHGILVGDPNRDQDRRITWISTPSFGIVGEDTTFEILVEDTSGAITAPVTLRVDGRVIGTEQVAVGETVTVTVPMNQPGEQVVELSLNTFPDELTLENNSVSAKINIIRDRLRVLLISGEPHAGERVWRNVLKSDPAVDLVHFTILKPAQKEAAARPEELNLIPFPSRELFLEKLKHFNLVIFDRYTYRGVITSFELAEVARYVERGGAVLIAAGPELSTGGSLAAQPNLSYILPAFPSGLAVEEGFVPTRTDIGDRHPITADLPSPEDWGRWLRRIPAEPRGGNVLMSADNGEPLLITDRVGEGRIAMLLSDHLWLWARGFDGGGPHREFLRRLGHWLMAEPELEEEALKAELSADGVLTLERQSLDDEVGLVTIERADGQTDTLVLEQSGPGLFTGSMSGVEDNLVRLETTTSDGRVLPAAAIKSRPRSLELDGVTINAEALSPLLGATGGGIARLEDAGAPLPQFRAVRASRQVASGRGWLGVTPRNARAVLSEARGALLPRWLYAIMGPAALFLAWLWESGRLLTFPRVSGSAPKKTAPAG